MKETTKRKIVYWVIKVLKYHPPVMPITTPIQPIKETKYQTHIVRDVLLVTPFSSNEAYKERLKVKIMNQLLEYDLIEFENQKRPDISPGCVERTAILRVLKK